VGDKDVNGEDTDEEESSSEEEIANSPASPEVLPITDLGETAPDTGVEREFTTKKTLQTREFTTNV
jgi:hypothetical protein